jgi:hypothetical protein
VFFEFFAVETSAFPVEEELFLTAESAENTEKMTFNTGCLDGGRVESG